MGAPWDEETDLSMPPQFGGGFQELADLAEVSDISGCGVAYPDGAA